ncbi:MAG: transglutaminase family protein [Caulobacter sp.]|nr:transglutaminase family protein [Caulobacter sp.]
MILKIEARLVYRFDQRCEVLLLLEAARSADQTVLSESLRIEPQVEIARLDDRVTGERRAVLVAEGDLTISYDASVEVIARNSRPGEGAVSAVRELPGEALRYLRPSRYCPSDRFESFVAREFGALHSGDQVAAMLAWINTHVDYRAGVSDVETTALDTFVDRAGVCRDFTHLAISLCRAAGVPARAVSAYAWGLEPPDMHAVMEVYLGGRWQLVDPTGRAPADGLVRVATGLDAADIAFMTIFGRGEHVWQTFTISRTA